jgi:hypothetical protein
MTRLDPIIFKKKKSPKQQKCKTLAAVRRCPHHFSFPFSAFTFFTLNHTARLLAPSLQETVQCPLSRLLLHFTIFLALGMHRGSELRDLAVLLLEIISGRHAIDVNYSPPSVVDWAMLLIKPGEFVKICDRRIGSRIQLSKPSLDSPVEPALPHVLRPRGLCRLWDEAVQVSNGH